MESYFPPTEALPLPFTIATVGATLGPIPQTNPRPGSGNEKTSGKKEDIWLEIDQTPAHIPKLPTRAGQFRPPCRNGSKITTTA